MKLYDLLSVTLDPWKRIGVSVFQVFPRGNGSGYYRLSDYVVSSAVSGPSLILVPREKKN